jgi:hypothetical protein
MTFFHLVTEFLDVEEHSLDLCCMQCRNMEVLDPTNPTNICCSRIGIRISERRILHTTCVVAHSRDPAASSRVTGFGKPANRSALVSFDAGLRFPRKFI